MSDRTPYNFSHGNDDGPSMHFQRQNDSKISTLIKACWLLVGEKLPCQREGANSEDV